MTARGCANRGSLYDYPVLSLYVYNCRGGIDGVQKLL